MSYQPLHQKYRPKTFADLVGQSAIADTLSNAIARQRIAHAYLFSGPRGTGKTSSARILAKSLNCLRSNEPTTNPCGECEACRSISNSSALDVIEIDAASNTGVDNIRELIERSSFAPVQCRYKLYIIDECHMLSTAAFNALLKTLEEPPSRVVFVLATTDPQRVLPTIISRCQRFDFQRIPLAAMVSHLGKIAEQEDIEITDEARSAIAQVAHGGLRDAQSLLDQLSLLSGIISIDRVWDLVGAIPEQDLIALLQAIKQQNGKEILSRCRQLMDRGREPIIVLENLAGFYRDLLIAKTAPQQSELVALTAATWEQLCKMAQEWDINEILTGQQYLQKSEAQIKQTTQPRLWLEVTLLGLLTANQPKETPQPVKSVSISQTPPSHETVKPSSHSDISPQKTVDHSAETPVEKTEVPVSAAVEAESQATPSNGSSIPSQSEEAGNEAHIWQEVLKRLSVPSQALFKEHCHLLAIEGNLAHVGVKNQKLLALAKNAKRHDDLEKALTATLHREMKVKLLVSSDFAPQVSPAEEKSAPPPVKKKEIPPQSEESQETDSPPVEKVTQAGSLEVREEPSSPVTETTREPQPPVETSQTTDEKTLEKVAKEFANAFKGEVLALDWETAFEDPPPPEEAEAEIEFDF